MTRPAWQDIARRLERQGALELAQRIASKHGVPLARVLGWDRQLSAWRARRELVAVVRWTLGLSQHEAGALFGRDHTTIFNACRAYERFLRREYA